MNELGKIREFRENKKTDAIESMVDQADELNRLLDSINLDDDYVNTKTNRDAVYGIDQEAIRKEETHEQLYDLREQYLNSVKILALEKMKSDILFESKLGAEMRRLSSLGLNITRENMFRDILSEIDKQQMNMNSETPSIENFNESIQSQTMVNSDEDTKNQIEDIKKHLKDIFESKPVQQQETIVKGLIPREPSIQSVSEYQEMTKEVETPSISQSDNNIKEDLEKALEAISQQPNEPTVVKMGEQTIQANIWDDLNGLERNSEGFFDRFERIYEIQVERLALLKAANSPDFESQLSIAVENILNSTDKMPNARKQLLSDIDFYLSRSYTKTESQVSARDNVIVEIIQLMYPEGVEYVPFNDIKKQLESYTNEQLEELKSQYMMEIQEQQEHMHR